MFRREHALRLSQTKNMETIHIIHLRLFMSVILLNTPTNIVVDYYVNSSNETDNNGKTKNMVRFGLVETDKTGKD